MTLITTTNCFIRHIFNIIVPRKISRANCAISQKTFEFIFGSLTQYNDIICICRFSWRKAESLRELVATFRNFTIIGWTVFTITNSVHGSVSGRRDDNSGDGNSVCSMGCDRSSARGRSSVRGSGLHVLVRIRMLMPGCLKLEDLK